MHMRTPHPSPLPARGEGGERSERVRGGAWRRAVSRSSDPAVTSSGLGENGIYGAPAVPGGYGTVGAIDLPEGVKGFGWGWGGEAVDGGETFANAEVVDGPHVGPPELEDQEHLRGPAADAAHLAQPLDNLGV